MTVRWCFSSFTFCFICDIYYLITWTEFDISLSKSDGASREVYGGKKGFVGLVLVWVC